MVFIIEWESLIVTNEYCFHWALDNFKALPFADNSPAFGLKVPIKSPCSKWQIVISKFQNSGEESLGFRLFKTYKNDKDYLWEHLLYTITLEDNNFQTSTVNASTDGHSDKFVYINKSDGNEFLFHTKVLNVMCHMKHTYHIEVFAHVPENHFADDLESLFYSESLYDVILIADRVEFKVHWNILSSRSPYFKRVKLESALRIILEISEIPARSMLLYIYTGKFPDERSLTVSQCSQLLEAAITYEMEHLEVQCIRFLERYDHARERRAFHSGMWCRPMQSPLLKRFLRLWHIEDILRSTHHSTGTDVPVLPLQSPLLKIVDSHRRKQKVIKKVDSKYDTKKIHVDPPPSIMLSQSVLLPGPERIRASGATNHPEKFLEFPDDKTHTVCDALMTGLLKSLSGECLGSRSLSETGKYEWISYAEVAERKNHIGSGILSLGLSQPEKLMVGICTKTRPEFVLTMLACSHYSMVLVPLYSCFGSDVLAQIIDQVEMEVIICETPKMAADIMAQSAVHSNLKHIILIEGDEEKISKLDESNVTIRTLKDLEIRGKLHPQAPKKPKPDDLFCLCYTSGTTGVPKGVMVTHKNVLSCIAALDTVLGDSIPSVNASLMCYLPCAHIYEIINEIFCLFHGGRLGFYSGNTENLLNDIAELKPAVLPLVPKLMNLIYFGIEKKIGPNPLRRYLFNFSLEQKEKHLKKGIVSKTAVWDKLMLAKIQKILGGCVQMIFTASAPISKEVMRFFRCSMGCMVFEAYGLSEVGAAAMTLISEHDGGFVGPPLPCNHIKLMSVPELSYLSEDDAGEICIRGANVFSGYYKNAETTAEAIDRDGWYHTGDIGKWLPNGTLSIIDRKKHIFKLSQGEYVVPEKTESIYIQSPIVLQIYVDGNSNQDFIVAMVVPDKIAFVSWAKKKGFTNDFDSLCQDKAVKEAVLIHLWKIGKEKMLNSLHQVGNICLTSEPFSIENGLLTPTLKLKRFNARKNFELAFEAIYTEGNLRKTLNR